MPFILSAMHFSSNPLVGFVLNFDLFYLHCSPFFHQLIPGFKLFLFPCGPLHSFWFLLFRTPVYMQFLLFVMLVYMCLPCWLEPLLTTLSGLSFHLLVILTYLYVNKVLVNWLVTCWYKLWCTVYSINNAQCVCTFFCPPHSSWSILLLFPALDTYMWVIIVE